MRRQSARAAADALLSPVQGADEEPTSLQAMDAVISIALAALAMTISVWAFAILGDTLHTEGSLDIWFQADTPRVLANLLDAGSNQYRANVHPIFPILFTPWLSALAASTARPILLAQGLVAVAGALSAASLFLTIRLLGASRLAASAFTALFLTSAAYLHWYGVVEIAALNGLSVCVALLLLALGRRAGWAAWVLASGFTLGMTLTNWSAGLAATIVRWPLRRATAISFAALMLVGGLAVMQRALYPTAGLFFDVRSVSHERDYAGPRTEGWSPAGNVAVLGVYSQVTPAPALKRAAERAIVSNQTQPPWAAGWLGLTGMLAWVLLLAAGVAAAVGTARLRPVALGVALMLGAQFALGMVYGDVSFLYAASVAPLLVVLAAFAAVGRTRAPALALVTVAIVAGGLNNFTQFQAAARLAADVIGSGGNPKWSRYPAGRVVLAVPSRKAEP